MVCPMVPLGKKKKKEKKRGALHTNLESPNRLLPRISPGSKCRLQCLQPLAVDMDRHTHTQSRIVDVEVREV